MVDAVVTPLQRTPLHAQHVALGAKMVPFGGWDMPVQYTSLMAEHQAVRQEVGLFDVSHMGEFLVSGPEAATFLARVVPGNVLDLPIGRALYTQFTNEQGGVVDDLLIYRLQDHYLLVVNASNIGKDWEYLQPYLPASGVTMTNASDRTALLALQGPRAIALLAENSEPDPRPLTSFGLHQGKVLGKEAIVSRTGYTGEDGVEIFLSPEDAPSVWQGFIDRGAAPCGLGARDTLRLEAGLPLYGHEWNDETTPIEAGFSWTVKSKADYIGKAEIEHQLIDGPDKRLVGLKMLGKAPAREGYEVLRNGEPCGHIASGTFSPTLGYPIATAYVPAEIKNGETLEVKIRASLATAEVVKLPFYRRPKS